MTQILLLSESDSLDGIHNSKVFKDEREEYCTPRIYVGSIITY